VVGILSIILFFIWLYFYTIQKEILENTITEADTGWESEEGSREDYLRAYQSESQREPYGNGQDFDGGRVSLRPWNEN
jgi:hypothetical protein